MDVAPENRFLFCCPNAVKFSLLVVGFYYHFMIRFEHKISIFYSMQLVLSKLDPEKRMLYILNLPYLFWYIIIILAKTFTHQKKSTSQCIKQCGIYASVPQQKYFLSLRSFNFKLSNSCLLKIPCLQESTPIPNPAVSRRGSHRVPLFYVNRSDFSW